MRMFPFVVLAAHRQSGGKGAHGRLTFNAAINGLARTSGPVPGPESFEKSLIRRKAPKPRFVWKT